MERSFEKQTIDYLRGVGLYNHLTQLEELVRDIMILLGNDEYLAYMGVFEANVKGVARQVNEVMKKNCQLSVLEAFAVVKKTFQEMEDKKMKWNYCGKLKKTAKVRGVNEIKVKIRDDIQGCLDKASVLRDGLSEKKFDRVKIA